MKREDGVLDPTRRRDKVEMRYHISTRNGRQVVTRIPWHLDASGVKYSGVPGPEMDFEALKLLVHREKT
jgi:hypothetical protein